MPASVPDPHAPRMAYVRCLDIAERWLTACGATVCVPMVDAFGNFSDERLADMCISRWRLDQPQSDDNDLTWFEAHEANREMLVWAFSAYRVFVTPASAEQLILFSYPPSVGSASSFKETPRPLMYRRGVLLVVPLSKATLFSVV